MARRTALDAPTYLDVPMMAGYVTNTEDGKALPALLTEGWLVHRRSCQRRAGLVELPNFV
jgi:hypothetical protein